MKALIVYHRIDYDGLISGMITRTYLEDKNYSINLLAYNYGDTIPEDIDTYDEYYLVDISFDQETMLRIKDKTTWIDHHVTAIETSKKFGYSDMKGIRRIGTAACELCWEYFYPTCQVPDIVSYIGAYDVWNKSKYDWENEVIPLQNALRVEYGMSMETFYPVFYSYPYFDEETMNRLFEIGRSIKKYEDYNAKSLVKIYSFPVTVAGKYKAVALLTPNFGSRFFDSILDEYDLYITANKKNNSTYNLSMYAEPGRLPDFNIGEYLKSFGLGGGGHACAGGTRITEEQFFNLITKGII